MEDKFKALNDGSRREIMLLLKDKPKTAGEIADHFEISKPSISHHLDLLKRADLISSTKKGQFIHYKLNVKGLQELFSWFIQFKPEEKVHLSKPKIRLKA